MAFVLTKCILVQDHLTGAMPDTSHDCKSIESKSCTSEQKEVGIDKHLINNVSFIIHPDNSDYFNYKNFVNL